jgi:hypothetical protein
MGRATLSSHYGDSKKQIHNNVGYWGEDFEPVEFHGEMPTWLERRTPGTNIVILGFKQFSRWDEILIAAVSVNFFAAINRGMLKVIVQGFEINADTLPEIFDMPQLLSLIESQSDVPRGDYERAKGYYSTYTAPDEEEEGEVLNLGYFKFYLKKRDDGQQNIGLLRDEMFITSSIPRLKRKFGASYLGFDMLIEPASSASNSLIKSMEPPAHDGLNTSWIDDKELRRKAESGMVHLRRRVTELLERHLKIEVNDEEHHSVFDKFFSISGGGEKISDATDPTGGFVFSNRQVKETFQSNAALLSRSWSHELETSDVENKQSNTPEKGNAPETNDDEKAEKQAPDLGAQESEDSVKEFKSKPVDLSNVKMRSLAADKFIIQFMPNKTGNLKLLVAEQGSDLKTMVRVKESNLGQVSEEGALFVDGEEGVKVQLEITLQKPLSGALSILASGS